MTYNPEIHHRRSIRLRNYDSAQAGAYFITVCAYNRECLFGEITNGEMHLSDVGRIVESEWVRTADIRHNVELDAFIIMPNHVHGIIVLTTTNDTAMETNVVGATRRVAHRRVALSADRRQSNLARLKPGTIGAIVGQFKPACTRRINAQRCTARTPIWQRNYYEHVIRDDRDLARIRNYIAGNPGTWLSDQLHPDISSNW